MKNDSSENIVKSVIIWDNFFKSGKKYAKETKKVFYL